MARFSASLFIISMFFGLINAETSTNTSESSSTCPNFDYFYYMIFDQCPTILDLRCVPYLPIDLELNMLTCSTMPMDPNNTIQIVEADLFLKLTKTRDQYGRPWCMLTVFYSPYCVFSANIADYVEKIPKIFPQLKVVAVDVSVNTRGVENLITQYGVASTPVMALWENGYPRYRIHELHGDLKMQNLVDSIKSHTDLYIEKINIEEPLDENREWAFKNVFSIESTKERTDWYFIAGVITLCFNLAYFVYYSPKAKEFLHQMRTEIFG